MTTTAQEEWNRTYNRIQRLLEIIATLDERREQLVSEVAELEWQLDRIVDEQMNGERI